MNQIDIWIKNVYFKSICVKRFECVKAFVCSIVFPISPDSRCPGQLGNDSRHSRVKFSDNIWKYYNFQCRKRNIIHFMKKITRWSNIWNHLSSIYAYFSIWISTNSIRSIHLFVSQSSGNVPQKCILFRAKGFKQCKIPSAIFNTILNTF